MEFGTRDFIAFLILGLLEECSVVYLPTLDLLELLLTEPYYASTVLPKSLFLRFFLIDVNPDPVLFPRGPEPCVNPAVCPLVNPVSMLLVVLELALVRSII